MRITTAKYIRKPLFVDAVRITRSNFEAMAEWCQGEIQQDEVPGRGTGKRFIRVRVHNPKNSRQTKAFVGDWLLYTERGYKIYTNKAFIESFDVVPSKETPSENEQSVMRHEEIVPGITVDDAVAMLRDGRLQAVTQSQPQTEEAGQSNGSGAPEDQKETAA